MQILTIEEKKQIVINNVTIPKYFKEIIIPQLPGYFDDYRVDFDSDPRACCPLHDENTPSFRYYEDSKSFYCFGCTKGGTVINLHRYFYERMNGVSVDNVDAINFLYAYFIDEKEVDIHKQVNVKNDKNNKNVVSKAQMKELLESTEQFIIKDTEITTEQKEELWGKLDELYRVSEIEEVDIDEARKYINRYQTEEHKKIDFVKNKKNSIYIRR